LGAVRGTAGRHRQYQHVDRRPGRDAPGPGGHRPRGAVMRVPVASALVLLLAVGSTPLPVAAQAVAPTATPTLTLEAGGQPRGRWSSATMTSAGGQFAASDGSVTVQAFNDPARPALTVVHQGVDARTIPNPQGGLSLGFAAFELSAMNDATQAPASSFNVP